MPVRLIWQLVNNMEFISDNNEAIIFSDYRIIEFFVRLEMFLEPHEIDIAVECHSHNTILKNDRVVKRQITKLKFVGGLSFASNKRYLYNVQHLTYFQL